MGVNMNNEEVIIKNQQGLERCITEKTNELNNQLQEIIKQQTLIIDYLENLNRILNR
jgi:hypothetical protein